MLNINDVLFHGLRGHNIKDIEKISLKRLSMILKDGSILSRRMQVLKYGFSYDTYSMYSRERPNFNKRETTNYNGDDYISACLYDDDTMPMTQNAYYMYVKTGISIILSKKLLGLLEYRDNVGMKKEYQVKDIISNEFFLGIAVPHINMNDILDWFSLEESIESIHQKIEIDFRVISEIRKMLSESKYNLPIFNILNGEEILSVEETTRELYNRIHMKN